MKQWLYEKLQNKLFFALFSLGCGFLAMYLVDWITYLQGYNLYALPYKYLGLHPLILFVVYVIIAWIAMAFYWDAQIESYQEKHGISH